MNDEESDLEDKMERFAGLLGAFADPYTGMRVSIHHKNLLTIKGDREKAEEFHDALEDMLTAFNLQADYTFLPVVTLRFRLRDSWAIAVANDLLGNAAETVDELFAGEEEPDFGGDEPLDFGNGWQPP